MALIKGVSELKAFQEAYTLAVEIRPITKNMPTTEQYSGIADQMRRASTGICANLAEGFGKNHSKTELRRYVRIAMSSAHEMDLWLSFAKDFGYIEQESVTKLRERYNLVCRLLNGFDQSLSTEH